MFINAFLIFISSSILLKAILRRPFPDIFFKGNEGKIIFNSESGKGLANKFKSYLGAGALIITEPLVSKASFSDFMTDELIVSLFSSDSAALILPFKWLMFNS